MNINILLNYINQYRYTILFTVFILVNFITLNNLPWGDDFPFIFDSNIKSAPNVWEFWNPFSKYFKSWPMAYSFLWSFIKLFHKDVFYYRAFNLFIHLLNSYLVYKLSFKIFKVNQEKRAFLIITAFLFHPISLITINWIFQIKTLLSMFFGLLTLICFYKINEKPKTFGLMLILSFFFALNSKIAVVLIPLFLFYKRSHINNKKVLWSLLAVVFSLSTYYGLINIKGIQAVWSEKKNINKSVLEYSETDKSDYKRDTFEKEIKELKQKKTLSQEIENSFDSFASQILKPEHITEKSLIALFTFGRYTTHTLGFNVFSIVYEKNSDSLYPNILISYSIVAFIFLWFLVSHKSLDALILSILFYLPISGLFYVPYMKISYISDHWFYLSLPFLLISIVQKIPYRLSMLITLIIIAQSFYTTYNFTTSERAISHSLKHYNNTFAKEYLVRHAVAVEDYNSAYLYTKEIMNDYSIKKDNITNAKFTLNAKYLSNKYLWDDVKDYVAKNYSEGKIKTMSGVLNTSIPHENIQEKQLLNFMMQITQGQYNEIMYQQIQNILANDILPSHRKTHIPYQSQ